MHMSRKDDLEAAFYIIFYLLNGCRLPWEEALSQISYNLDSALAVRVDQKYYDELLARQNSKRIYHTLKLSL